MTTVPQRVPYAEAARELLRNTLLDAATDLLRTRSWQHTKMADIAKAAGVSRQTLYKEFGSRQAFAESYILRESERFLNAVEEAVAARLDAPREALSAAIEVFLVAAGEEPLIRAIVAGDESDGLLSVVTNHAGPLLDGAKRRLANHLSRSWPDADPVALEPIAECLVRLAVSHAASPASTPAETAGSISTVLSPYLVETVGY
ncbi:TetR family transcriptional regulator [Parasphingorhabdus pacifica]